MSEEVKLSSDLKKMRKSTSGVEQKKFHFTPEEYHAAVAVNDAVDYETSRSLTKKMLSHVLFTYLILETVIIQGFFLIFIRPFLSNDSKLKNDFRRWPVAFLYMTAKPVLWIKHRASDWTAVDRLYNWNKETTYPSGIGKLATYILEGVDNILATRNRFRNFKREYFEEFRKLLESGRDVVSLSIAAGSARGPLEVAHAFLKKDPTAINHMTFYLVDADNKAYEKACEIADELHPGLKSRLHFIKMKISGKPEGLQKFRVLLSETNPNIVEMVGFGDYLSDEKAKNLNSIINEHLQDGGVFITNNVKPNHEQLFIKIVVSYRMNHRTEKRVLGLLNDAGFAQVRTLNEPTDIQPIYVCRKGIF